MITIVIHRASRETLRKDLKFLIKTCNLEETNFISSNTIRIKSVMRDPIQIVGFVGNDIETLGDVEPDFYQVSDNHMAHQLKRKTNGIELESISQIVRIIGMLKDKTKTGGHEYG